MILRLSNDLAKKVHAPPLEPRPLHDHLMADWSARVFSAGRTQMVLFVHTASFYPCIFPGRGLTDPLAFVTRAIEELREVVRSDALLYKLESQVIPAIDVIEFAKPLNRSTIGSMNDQVRIAKYHHGAGDPFVRIVQQLAGMPMSVLKGEDGRPYCTPGRTLKSMLDRVAHSADP